MAEHWLRWHVGTCSDPKWRLIAKRSGQPLHVVLALWPVMLECAKQASIPGQLDGWDDEDVAAGMDLEPEQVTAVRMAMRGKVLTPVTPCNASNASVTDAVSKWDKRQPKREREDDSGGRVRAFRDRQKAQETAIYGDVTPRNASVTPCNALEESRGEEKKDTSSLRSDDAPRVSADAEAAATSPEKPIVEILFGSCLRYLVSNGIVDKQARSVIGKWRRDYGDGEVAAAIGEAQKDAASEPIPLVTAILLRRREARARAGPGRAVPYSNAALARSLLQDIDHEHDSTDPGRNGAALHRAEGHREPGAGSFVPAGHLRLAGPHEPDDL